MTLSLIADIGGTNARFALVKNSNIVAKAEYKCADFDSLTDAARHFINEQKNTEKPVFGVFAVAGPVNGDQIDLTNFTWKFSIDQVGRDLNFSSLEVINDFKAVAMGITHVGDDHIKIIYDAPKHATAPIGVIGPGTGLGTASLIHDGVKYIAVEGEGGHVTMPARTQREFDIFQQLLSKYSHISAERVCSGKGIENLYNAICALDGKPLNASISATIISERGIEKSCPICAEVMDLMCAFLGRVTGNLALILKAHGGIYIAGGIPPKLGDYFFQSRFVDEYTSKGRMSDVVKSIPVFMITHPHVAMLGLAHRADEIAKTL